uniref:PCI domain-containing protein n=1 Tax=Steinernema glaseri TaxID=37863 RepID=A0A1I7Y4X0_9BILA
MDAMCALASAFKTRSLKKFLQSFETFKKQLDQDPLIKMQFQTLSETMIEKELTRLIEPYSIVEIDHLTRLIQLPKERVEKKLAQMILDQKLKGCINQNSGTITIYDPENKNHAYEPSVKLIHALSKVVDSFANRSGKIKVA